MIHLLTNPHPVSTSPGGVYDAPFPPGAMPGGFFLRRVSWLS